MTCGYVYFYYMVPALTCWYCIVDFHTSVGFYVTHPTAMAMLGPQGVEWLNVEFPRLSFIK